MLLSKELEEVGIHAYKGQVYIPDFDGFFTPEEVRYLANQLLRWADIAERKELRN